jgi:hypothetical protein
MARRRRRNPGAAEVLPWVLGLVAVGGVGYVLYQQNQANAAAATANAGGGTSGGGATDNPGGGGTDLAAAAAKAAADAAKAAALSDCISGCAGDATCIANCSLASI